MGVWGLGFGVGGLGQGNLLAQLILTLNPIARFGSLHDGRLRNKGVAKGKEYPIYTHKDGKSCASRKELLEKYGVTDPEPDGRSAKAKAKGKAKAKAKGKAKAKAKAARARSSHEDPESQDESSGHESSENAGAEDEDCD